MAAPSCLQLMYLVAKVTDPLYHLDASGSLGEGGYWPKIRVHVAGEPYSQTPVAVDYKVHFGGPKLPYRLPVTVSSPRADQRVTLVQLLQLSYDFPAAFTACLPTQGFWHSAGRERAIKALTGRIDLGLVAPIGYVLARAFNDPKASNSPGEAENAVVTAAAALVLDDKAGYFDSTAWLPLWGWALGGPNGRAAVRTRVMAMKALQAILRRGKLLPGEVRAAGLSADVLKRLVDARAPSVPAAEREWFLSEAAALVGAVSFARIQAETAPSVPGAGSGLPDGAPPDPPSDLPGWVIPAIGGVIAAGALTVGAIAIAKTRAAALRVVR